MTNGISLPQPPALLDEPHKAFAAANWSDSSLQLRLWRSPSFQALRTWAVVIAAGNLRLRRVVWESSIDWEAKKALEAIDTIEVELSSATFNALGHELANISLRAFSQSGGGLDGTTYGIERSDLAGDTKLSWWEGAPRDWGPLVEWYLRAAAGRSIATNNESRRSEADIVAIALSSLSFLKASPAMPRPRSGRVAGSGAADEFSVDPFHSR